MRSGPPGFRARSFATVPGPLVAPRRLEFFGADSGGRKPGQNFTRDGVEQSFCLVQIAGRSDQDPGMRRNLIAHAMHEVEFEFKVACDSQHDSARRRQFVIGERVSPGDPVTISKPGAPGAAVPRAQRGRAAGSRGSCFHASWGVGPTKPFWHTLETGNKIANRVPMIFEPQNVCSLHHKVQ